MNHKLPGRQAVNNGVLVMDGRGICFRSDAALQILHCKVPVDRPTVAESRDPSPPKVEKLY